MDIGLVTRHGFQVSPVLILVSSVACVFSIVWFSIHLPQYIITETLATFQSGSIHLDTSPYEEANVILHGKEHNPWTGPPEPVYQV